MLKRAVTIAGLAGVTLIAGVTPALADGYGYTDCSQFPNPGCELGAGKGGNQGGDRGNGPAKPGNPGHHNPGAGPSDPGGDTIIGGNNLAQCGYERSGYQGPPPGSAQPAAFRTSNENGTVLVAYRSRGVLAAQAPGGAWYVYKCTGSGFRDALYRPPVWIADGQPGPAPLPSPAELAAQARNQLRLPAPKINANPAGDQLVSLPTWMWLDSGSWGDVSATAAVPGVSVTAVAKPTSVTWSMGDGASVTCGGPGSSFPAGGDPKSASPDCGHTYRRSSVGQRAEAFPVTATVNWTVSWSGAGQSGTFPNMTTTGDAAFRVAESQGIATG